MLGEKLELNDIPFLFQEHTTVSNPHSEQAAPEPHPAESLLAEPAKSQIGEPLERIIRVWIVGPRPQGHGI